MPHSPRYAVGGTSGSRARRLPPDERREQIVACAVRLFGQRPYAQVSAAEIAREAGIARGLL
ncbi:helix-turn-helix domain-containing protein, partial [uncultured Nocardioides sp.]